jgi:hypothetical protein
MPSSADRFSFGIGFDRSARLKPLGYQARPARLMRYPKATVSGLGCSNQMSHDNDRVSGRRS